MHTERGSIRSDERSRIDRPDGRRLQTNMNGTTIETFPGPSLPMNRNDRVEPSVTK